MFIKTCRRVKQYVFKLIRHALKGGRTFTVKTIKAWNSITSDLKKSHSPSIFKRNFLKYFLTKQRETLTFESFL